MIIWVVRHGEKEKGDYYNPLLHHQDQPLSVVGKQEAEKLEVYFDSLPIQEIRVSQFVRTSQTAESIVKKKKLQPIIDARLNEIDNGVIETMTEEQIQTTYSDFWKTFTSYSRDVRFPGGETGEEVKLRQDSLLQELIQKNQNTLLVCHEGFMRLLLCNLLGLPLYQRNRFSIDPCGIIKLEYRATEKLWRVICVNASIS